MTSDKLLKRQKSTSSTLNAPNLDSTYSILNKQADINSKPTQFQSKNFQNSITKNGLKPKNVRQPLISLKNMNS
jgi:hypothetical protein